MRDALRDAGLRARHGLSQNFLADVDILERIVTEAAPSPARSILEIGPGLGVLTGALLDAGAPVLAIELDRGLADRLRTRFAQSLEIGNGDAGAAGGLRLVEGDVLDEPVPELVRPPYDVVANLPYHITSPILHRMLGEWPRPVRAVLMVQREVAERIAAPPGAMSYLSVFVQYHARVRLAFIVPPMAFEPAPAVDSAVVVVEPYVPAGSAGQAAPAGPAVPAGQAASADPAVPADPTILADPAIPARLDPDREDALWRLVQAGFRERRKMLHNVLSRQLPVPAERVAAALGAADVAPDRRPQTVSVAEWIRILDALGPIGPDERGQKHHAAERGR